MKVRVRGEEMRKRSESMCVLDKTSGKTLVGKRFDMRFFMEGGSKFSVRNKVKGDSTEY